MKRFAMTLAGIMGISVNLNALDESPAGLDSLRWKHRVILVFAREPFRSTAVTNLNEYAAEIEEREIAWFVLDEVDLDTNYDGKLERELRADLMERYFNPIPTDPVVLLIGKDGALKSRSSELDLEATFGLIDQMPMRQEEMRRKSDNSD
jgi:hypothetical protein